MNREQLTERIAALEKQREQQANLQIATINGAIAENEWQLDKPVEAEPVEEA